jgi:phosphoribosylformylglycinamidine synthase
MTVAVKPRDLERFMALSVKHAVESTVVGKYTDSGKLLITYNGGNCAYVDLDLLTSGFPQWEFDAYWLPPEMRGLHEPVIKEPADFNQLLLDMLSRPNICSKEWICRQYDHEVQGSSVIKPLVGEDRDIFSDAAVIRPVLNSTRGLAMTQALLPNYSVIDAYHMTTCTIDEAVRRLIAVGAGLDHIGGVDNFCWPNIAYHPVDNPDGRFKAAQLVRSCWALREMCLDYEIPLLSGKDSMYVDGHLPGRYGEVHKVSALETIQFTTIGVIDDITKCVTLDSKMPGDRIYILGLTRNELGGSEYYDRFGYTGRNVPRVFPQAFKKIYQSLTQAIDLELVASAHGVYRGGLGVHLAMVAMGGNLGLELDLSKVPADQAERDDVLLFSESPGRFIVTVDPENREAFEQIFKNHACVWAGTVTESPDFTIKGIDGRTLVSRPVLEKAFRRSGITPGYRAPSFVSQE